MLVFLLAGCAKREESRNVIPLTYGSYDVPSAEPRWVTLYYEDNGRVLAFPQQLDIGDGSLYACVLDAMLSGTKEGYKSNMWINRYRKTPRKSIFAFLSVILCLTNARAFELLSLRTPGERREIFYGEGRAA